MRLHVIILIIIFDLFLSSMSATAIPISPMTQTSIKSAEVASFYYYLLKQSLPEEEAPAENHAENIKDIENKEKVITISLAGDCTIGWDETSSYTYSLPYQLEKENKDYGYFFRQVKPIFETDDLTLINLETTFTEEKEKANKRFRFKGDPTYVNIIKEGNIDMVNISNNHIYDYLEKGFDDTVKTLEEGEIKYSGEGHIAYHSTKGVVIGSLGYRGWSSSIKDRVAKDIQQAKEKAEIIIVSYHWGKERNNVPNETQVDLGRFAIDQGADLVVGHHPHVIQGIEKYNGKYIIYSLGNFSFGGNKNPRDKDSFIFQDFFHVKDGKMIKNEGKIIPCLISSEKNRNNYQPITVEGEEGERILNRIYKYSEGLQYGISKEEI